MVSMSRARQKWENNTADSADFWKSQVQGASDEFTRGLADFAGVSAGEITADDEWRAGVQDVSAGEFRNAVSGKGDKWQRNFVEGITR